MRFHDDFPLTPLFSPQNLSTLLEELSCDSTMARFRNLIFVGVLVGVVGVTTSTPGLISSYFRDKTARERVLPSQEDKNALKSLRGD